MTSLSPDVALLAAGWERNAETDQYRRPGIDEEWMSHDAALFLAHYHEEASTEEAPISTETSVILLLVDILKELRTIGRVLGKQPPSILFPADIEHQKRMDAIAEQAEAAAARKIEKAKQ